MFPSHLVLVVSHKCAVHSILFLNPAWELLICERRGVFKTVAFLTGLLLGVSHTHVNISCGTLDFLHPFPQVDIWILLNSRDCPAGRPNCSMFKTEGPGVWFSSQCLLFREACWVESLHRPAELLGCGFGVFPGQNKASGLGCEMTFLWCSRSAVSSFSTQCWKLNPGNTELYLHPLLKTKYYFEAEL